MGLDSTERLAPHRSGHADGALYPAWGPPYAHFHPDRPEHVERTVDQDAGFGPEAAKRADLAVSVRACGRDRSPPGHGAPLPARSQPVSPRLCRPLQDSRGSRVGWGRNHVSRLPGEVEEDRCEMRI